MYKTQVFDEDEMDGDAKAHRVKGHRFHPIALDPVTGALPASALTASGTGTASIGSN